MVPPLSMGAVWALGRGGGNDPSPALPVPKGARPTQGIKLAGETGCRSAGITLSLTSLSCHKRAQGTPQSYPHVNRMIPLGKFPLRNSLNQRPLLVLVPGQRAHNPISAGWLWKGEKKPQNTTIPLPQLKN